MGLLINQGKQAVDDNGIIVAKDAVCQITSVKLHPRISQALLIGFKVMSGAAKGKTFFDTINYDPNHAMAWKYTHLRRCAGVPYSDKEGAQVDIESLLLNKCVQCDLDKRLDKNGDEWQNCKYKKLSADAMSSMSSIAPTGYTSSTSNADGWDDNDMPAMQVVMDEDEGDLPF